LLKNLLPGVFSARTSGTCPDVLTANQSLTRLFRRRSHPWLRQQATENLLSQVFQQPARRLLKDQLLHHTSVLIDTRPTAACSGILLLKQAIQARQHIIDNRQGRLCKG
jgi:hypothetical protein